MSFISSPPPSILKHNSKRPPPLMQDDFQPLLSATFKLEFSPRVPSPHVHFPPTPVLSTTITASIKGYDVHTAQISKSPADVPTPTFDHSYSSMTSSSDASSSDSDDGTTDINSPSVRFAKVPNSPIPRARSQQEIDKALSFLPYPLSPRFKIPRPSFFKSRRHSNASSPLAAGPNEKSIKSAKPRATKRRSQKPTPRLPALIVTGTTPYDGPRFVPPGLWPQTALSPVPESPALTLECPSSDEASDTTTSTLRSAFWRAVSVQQSSEEERETARGSQNSLASSAALLSPPALSPALLSPPPASPYPIFLFGRRADGSLWSPGLPRRKPRVSTPEEPAIFSPATTVAAAKSFELMISPAPNDNISSFSSFAAALEYLGADEIAVVEETTV
jgi:hypothetical protein